MQRGKKWSDNKTFSSWIIQKLRKMGSSSSAIQKRSQICHVAKVEPWTVVMGRVRVSSIQEAGMKKIIERLVAVTNVWYGLRSSVRHRSIGEGNYSLKVQFQFIGSHSNVMSHISARLQAFPVVKVDWNISETWRKGWRCGGISTMKQNGPNPCLVRFDAKEIFRGISSSERILLI